MENPVSIVSDPQVMMGKPVIAGTRITVELILEKLAAGETTEQILVAHPCLTPAAISIALVFTKDTFIANTIHPTPTIVIRQNDYRTT
jgi:uncharacterized protein (DUF433 family)